MSDNRFVTKTGRILTDEDFEALADEAEAGYDVSEILRRREGLTDDEWQAVSGILAKLKERDDEEPTDSQD